MDKPIELSSGTLRLTDSSINPADFYQNIHPAIELPHDNYGVCLLKANLWNTAVNIDSKTLVWGYGGTGSGGPTGGSTGTSVTVNIPTGNYTVNDINKLLQKSIIAEGKDGLSSLGSITYPVAITANYNTNRAVINIDDTLGDGTVGFYIDFREPDNIAALLGFEEDIFFITQEGYTIANITGGADKYQIRCDMVRGSFDPANSGGGHADILYSFAPQVPVAAEIEVNPLHLVFLQCRSKRIDRIRMRITNQNGQLVDFNGSDVAYTLLLRPFQKL